MASPRRAKSLSSRQLDWLLAAGLVLFTALVYAQSLGFDFTNYDDTAYVPDNTHVRDGFSLCGIGWACTTFETANWYPLTWLSLMLDCQLFGPRPGGHHAVNALLHAIDAVLLFVALRRMTGRRWPSAAVAALFAAHPLHVESVAWIAERKDVLSTLFFLLALLTYHRYAARPGVGRWSAVFLCMALGLLCKSMLVTLPFVLLLLDYWPLGRFRNSPVRPLVLEKLPLLALSVATSIVTVVAQSKLGATAMLGDETYFGLRLANAAVSYVKYLAMTVWPGNLAVFYPYEFQLPSLLVAASIAVLIAVTLFAVIRVRRAPYLAVGWFWYLGTLVPTIGLIQVGGQAMADRYTYIPSIGLFLAVVWAVADRQSALRGRFAIAAVFCGVLAALLIAAHRQAAYWVDSEHLFRHAVAVTGDNPESCENLGDFLLHHERYAEAEEQFRKVLALDTKKRFRQTPPELAQALDKQQRVPEAVAMLRGEMRDDSKYTGAMCQLAMILALRRIDIGEAIDLLTKARELEPKQAAIPKQLAWIYATCPDRRFRNGPKAVELAREACELTDWSNAAYRLTLAEAYWEAGNRSQALEELRAAQKLSPNDGNIAVKLREYSVQYP